jgi:hypothetical protein
MTPLATYLETELFDPNCKSFISIGAAKIRSAYRKLQISKWAYGICALVFLLISLPIIASVSVGHPAWLFTALMAMTVLVVSLPVVIHHAEWSWFQKLKRKLDDAMPDMVAKVVATFRRGAIPVFQSKNKSNYIQLNPGLFAEYGAFVLLAGEARNILLIKASSFWRNKADALQAVGSLSVDRTSQNFEFDLLRLKCTGESNFLLYPTTSNEQFDAVATDLLDLHPGDVIVEESISIMRELRQVGSRKGKGKKYQYELGLQHTYGFETVSKIRRSAYPPLQVRFKHLK